VNPTINNKETTMSIPDFMPTLSVGSHKPYEGKACVMEYVALLAGEEWTDSPRCAYFPLARAAAVVNDNLPDRDRHRLVPLIGRLFGTTLPIDDRRFALAVARTVEFFSPAAAACNAVTERFLDGTATAVEREIAVLTARGFHFKSLIKMYSTNAAIYASTTAGHSHINKRESAAGVAITAAQAAMDFAPIDGVAWLSTVIDIYDELSGRTEHREVNEAELRVLAAAVRGES